MPDIHVYPHGSRRWAVADEPAGTPLSEFATCEEAQSAARVLAAERGGGEVVVSQDDPTGLSAVEDAAAGEAQQTGVSEPTPPLGGANNVEPEQLRGVQGSF